MSISRQDSTDEGRYDENAPPEIAVYPPASGSTSFFHMLEVLAQGSRKRSKSEASELASPVDSEAAAEDEAPRDVASLENEASEMQHTDEVKGEMERDQREATDKTPDSTPSYVNSVDYLHAHDVKGEELEKRLADLTRNAIVPEGDMQGVFNNGASTKDISQASSAFQAREAPGTYIPTDNKADPQTDPKRLELLQKAFGPCEYLPNDEAEAFVQESQGMLVGQVLIKGRLFLTNTRLIFYAMLPSLEKDNTVRHTIKAGPISTHMGGFGGKGRYYAVLTRDSLSLHKSSKDMYTPKGMLGLNDIVKIVEPDDVFEPIIRFSFIARQANGQRGLQLFEADVDTAEEAIAWRREISSAVFAFQNKRDRYRASLPLDRVVSAERNSFFGFSEVANIIVEKDPGESRSLRLGVPRSETTFWEQLDKRLAHVLAVIPKASIPMSAPAVVDLFAPPITDRPLPHHRSTSQSTVDAPVEDDPDDEAHDVPANKIERRKMRLAAAHQVDSSDIDTVYHAELPRFLSPVSGVLGFGRKGLLFYARRAIGDTKIRVPTRDIQGARTTSSIRFSVYGLRVLVRGHEDLEFDLHSKEKRDRALADLLALSKQDSSKHDDGSVSNVTSPVSPRQSPGLESVLSIPTVTTPTSIASTSSPQPSPELGDSTRSLGSRKQLPGGFGSYAGARKELPFGSFIVGGRKIEPSSDSVLAALDEHVQKAHTVPMRVPMGASSLIPRAINFDLGDLIVPSTKVCLMTIGSRGDVQPYIALGRRLMRGGQDVTIATHPEYKEWVEKFKIKHKPIGGDPTLLMQVSVEHKIFSLETVRKFSKWLDDLLDESYAATEGMDLVVESPSTMAGIHVCEARKIPYMRAFTMPWTRTKAFPHAFMSNSADTNGSFNYSTYILFENIMWKASSGHMNRFRHKVGLESTDLEKMRQREIPFIYNFSTAVVPRPLDWPEHVQVSGYWFLDSESDWEPPEKLTKFLDKAKQEQKPVVYIGFGSITVPDPAAVTRAVIEAVEQTGVLCILCKGWSGRGSKAKDDVKVPDSILQLSSVPHDWLFNRIDAAMHHGGAGTTAASLRAGLPTLIKPFFGDQYFWARTVTNNGSGLRVHSLSAKDMGDAISQAVNSRIMREKAEQIGEKLRAEDGLGRAIKFISQYYVRALKRTGVHADELEKAHNILAADNPMKDASISGRTDLPMPTGQPLSHTNTVTSTLSRILSPAAANDDDDAHKPERKTSILSAPLSKLPSLHLPGSSSSSSSS